MRHEHEREANERGLSKDSLQQYGALSLEWNSGQDSESKICSTCSFAPTIWTTVVPGELKSGLWLGHGEGDVKRCSFLHYIMRRRCSIVVLRDRK